MTEAPSIPTVLSSVRNPFVTESMKNVTASTPNGPVTLNVSLPLEFVVADTGLFVQ